MKLRPAQVARSRPTNIRTGAFCRRIILTLGLLTTAQAQLNYLLTNLGTMGHDYSVAVGINSGGQIIGTVGSIGAYTGIQSFIYSNGVMSDLGNLGGNTTYVAAINDSGGIVGQANLSPTGSGVNDWHGFYYAAGHMTDMGTLPGSTNPSPQAINNAGSIVGAAYMTDNSTIAIAGVASYAGNGFQASGLSLGGTSATAKSINAGGQITGWASLPGNSVIHAFSYRPENIYDGISERTFDLGTLGGSYSYGISINSTGTVVGSSTLPGDSIYHAFVSAGTLQDLGALASGEDSAATSINSSGAIVGYSSLDPSGDVYHGFLYRNGTMIDLNSLIVGTPGLEIINAVGINNAGQIAANATDGTNQFAVLLTPTAIPEPSTYALLIGFGVVGGIVWRRRSGRDQPI